VDIPIAVRALEPEDLPDLDWTGGPEHLRAIAQDLAIGAAGGLQQLVLVLPNGRLVGFGGVDFRTPGQAGTIWMLSVHEAWQSLGLGTLLIRALEQRIVTRGRTVARIGVEHDNPRARALYLRLGYRESGSSLESWPIGAGRRYVTVSQLFERKLP
jgi:ribosomal protein S18 acetylase RimI-like enzyme